MQKRTWYILEAAAVIIILVIAVTLMTPKFLESQNNINTPQHIPDPNFRAFIEEYMGVEPGKPILKEDAFNIQEQLDCSDLAITSLKGIEYFPSIPALLCSNNELTHIDISRNTELTALNCTRNQLTSIDLSSNNKLMFLYCDYNRLTSIDICQNPKLTIVGINFNLLESIANFRELKYLIVLYVIQNNLSSNDLDDIHYFYQNPKIKLLFKKQNNGSFQVNPNNNEITFLSPKTTE